jgi:hypothetical protein
VITLSEEKLADLWPMGDIRPPSQYRKPWDPWGAPESMIVEDDDPRGVRLDGPDADDGASSAGSEYKGNTPAPAGTKSGPPAGQAGVGREPGEGEMYKVLVCNGSETWVARTVRTWRAAVKVAEKVRREMASAVAVWIEKK